MSKVVVIEGNSLLCGGLSILLRQHQDIEVVGTAENIESAMVMLGELPKVDVILTNLFFGDYSAFDFIKWCKTAHASASVVALVDNYNHDIVRSALLVGVESFALKQSSLEELLDAIQRVAVGEPYLPKAIYDLLVVGYLDPESLKSSRRGRKDDSPLTQKEREVLILVAEGRTNKQIAKVQQVSIKTVEKHRSNFMRKLGLRNSAEVARYAVSRGLLAVMESRDDGAKNDESGTQANSPAESSAKQRISNTVQLRPTNLSKLR